MANYVFLSQSIKLQIFPRIGDFNEFSNITSKLPICSILSLAYHWMPRSKTLNRNARGPLNSLMPDVYRFFGMYRDPRWRYPHMIYHFCHFSYCKINTFTEFYGGKTIKNYPYPKKPNTVIWESIYSPESKTGYISLST